MQNDTKKSVETGCAPVDDFEDLIPHEWTQRPFYVRFILAVLGIVLIGAGTLFWLMPVVPGFFLVPIGIVLMGAASKRVALWVNALDRKMPLRFRRIVHGSMHKCRHLLPHRHPRRPPAKPEMVKSAE